MPINSGLKKYLNYRRIIAKEAFWRFIHWCRDHPIISIGEVIALAGVAYFSGLEIAENQLLFFVTAAGLFWDLPTFGSLHVPNTTPSAK